MSIKIGNNILAKSSTYHPDLFDIKWADHILNNVSWLRADTFSWHYASMYPRVYQHLYSDIAQQGVIQYYGWTSTNNVTLYTTSENPAIGDTVYNYANQTMNAFVVLDDTMEATSLYIKISTAETDIYTRDPSTDTVVRAAETEVVAGIPVQYFLSSDGHKVVAPEYTEAVNQIYNATGLAWYYIVDTKNKRFKLPRKHSNHVVQSVNLGDRWYKIYADGWAEQGGTYTGTTDGWVETQLPVKMRNTNYQVTINRTRKTDTGDPGSGGIDRRCFMTNGYTQTSFKHWGMWATYPCNWVVRGFSALEPSTWESDQKYLYMYVGDYTQASVENIAGINMELFNEKADKDQLEHIVVETQLPTAENNYSWYRLYNDGFVEQGGKQSIADAANVNVTFLIPMADTGYSFTSGQMTYNQSNNTYTNGWALTSYSEVGFTIHSATNGTNMFSWQVCGMAA